MTGPNRFHSIFARNCEIRRIDKKLATEFLEKNHLYGYAEAKYRYGMFVRRYSGAEMKAEKAAAAAREKQSAAGCECVRQTKAAERAEVDHPYPIGTLVAVATFSNARHWNREDRNWRSCQWIRYASLPEVRVIGGMGKFLDHFIEEVNPDDIMSYAPAEHFSGEVYETLGFVREGIKTFDSETHSIKFRLKVH